MAYMGDLKQAVLFGGSTVYGDPLGDTWIWSNGCWTQKFPAHSPHPQHYVVMAYDGARGVAVMYTPGIPSPTEQATWTWDGTDWTKAADGPGIESAPASIAYDQANRDVVLFGAVDNSGGTGTWTWSGSSWRTMNPLHAPPARRDAAMASDPKTSNVLLFGGMTFADGQQNNDTWRWDGIDWTKLNPSASPAAREGAAMASFVARSQVLLVGGWAAAPFSDVWEWDGSNWQQVANIGPRQNASAVDTGQSVLVFGGTLQNKANTDSWDGVTWSNQ